MIKKTIFICCERVEKAKKVLSDFVRKEYSVASAASTYHDLVNKATGPNIWVQWLECDHENIMDVLNCADKTASHFIGLTSICEIPRIALVIKGMAQHQRLIPVYLAYQNTMSSSEQVAENEQLNRVLKLLLAK